MVRAIINLKVVLLTLNCHLSTSNAVCHAAYGLTCAWAIAKVAQWVFITQDNIGNISLTVSKLNAYNTRADIAQLHLRAEAIFKCVDYNSLTLSSRSLNML
jgi:hypothetical protein